MLPPGDSRKRPASLQTASNNKSDDDWSDLTAGSGSPRFSLGSSDESPQEQEAQVVSKTDKATQYSNDDWNNKPELEPTDEPDGDLREQREKPTSTMLTACSSSSSRKEAPQAGVHQPTQHQDASGLRRGSQTAQVASTKASATSATSARSREKRNRGRQSKLTTDTAEPACPASSTGDSSFPSIATQEAAFVACVALTLVGYVVACIYSFFHPIHVPLPTLESLQQPYDVSDVALQILHPANDSTVLNGPVHLEWALQQFPTNALELFGPEPFHYRVYINDVQIVSEIGFLGLTGNDDLRIQDNAMDEPWINTTLRERLLPRLFPTAGSYVIHVEVAFPIPGDHGRVHKLHDRVYLQKTLAATTEHRLRILSPSNASVFTRGQPVVLEYEALNLHALQVAIDGDVAIASKVRVNDGNLLLRGLGPGGHHVELHGFAADYQQAVAASAHFTIVPSLEEDSH